MDVGLELLQLLLLGDAEMLLLVDHEQPEMGEVDILGEQRVGADDDVEAALGELLLDFARLLGGNEPRELSNVQRQSGEIVFPLRLRSTVRLPMVWRAKPRPPQRQDRRSGGKNPSTPAASYRRVPLPVSTTVIHPPAALLLHRQGKLGQKEKLWITPLPPVGAT